MNWEMNQLPWKGCETCGVWETRQDCRKRTRYMKQTGVLNKVGCWRPKGVILIWGEEDATSRRQTEGCIRTGMGQ